MRAPKFTYVIAALVVAGACSSSKSSSNSTTIREASTTTAAAADPARDLATAKAAVLTADDLPGFTTTPHKDSDEIPTTVTQHFATCLDVDDTLLDDTPGAQVGYSPDFDQDQTTVRGEVEIDPTRADIDKGWTAFTKPQTASCLEKLFTEMFNQDKVEGVTFGAPKVTAFDVGIGDRSKGYAVEIPASVPGEDVVFYSDFILVARDRAGVQLTTFNLGAPFDRTKAIALAQTMYERIGTKAA